EGLVSFPIGALVMIVGTQEGMETLRAVPHVVVRLAGRVVNLVVLARSRQLRQFVIDRAGAWRDRWALRGAFNRIEGQRRHPSERRRHHRNRAEHVWSYHGAVGGH